MIFIVLVCCLGSAESARSPDLGSTTEARPSRTVRRDVSPPFRTPPSISAEALEGGREDSSLQASKEVPGAIGSSAEAVRSLDLTSTRPVWRLAEPSVGQGAMCVAAGQGRRIQRVMIIVAWSQLIVELPGAIRSPAEAARSLDLDRPPRHSRTTTRTPAPPPPAPGRSPPSALCPWPRRSSLLPSIGPRRRCEQPGGGAFDEGRIVGGHARPTQRPTKPAKPII